MPDFTLIEPFCADTVVPLPLPTEAERERALEAAGFSLYGIPSELVTIDLLTDSGIGALSARQRARMLEADEAYAGSRSFRRLEEVVRDFSGFPEVIPVPQGRAAERIVCQMLVCSGDIVAANTHFNTTRANVEEVGALAVDLAIAAARQPHVEHPFKGNIDLAALEHALRGQQRVAMVVLTVTDNSGGGHPVSLANLEAASELCKKYGALLFLDACRFAENAYLVGERDPAAIGFPARDIARQIFDYSDGAWISAKKDGLSTIGGVLLLRDGDLAKRCRELLPLTTGLPSYGGLSGSALEMMAQGFVEVLDEAYLAHRVGMVRSFAAELERLGIPILQPAGGHAVYLDASSILPHLSPDELPAQALAVELFRRGGVRACEIGSVMFGRRGADGTEEPWSMELVRLAIPRRRYSTGHLAHVASAVAEVVADAPRIRGMRFVSQPTLLRHFTARFAWRSQS